MPRSYDARLHAVEAAQEEVLMAGWAGRLVAECGDLRYEDALEQVRQTRREWAAVCRRHGLPVVVPADGWERWEPALRVFAAAADVDGDELIREMFRLADLEAPS